MSFSHLKIVGPISTLVTSVRVQGQLLGAQVSIISLADNQLKAEGIATRKDQRFELLPNILLNKNDRLVVTQSLGADANQLPPDYYAIQVQQAPQVLSEIGAVKIEGSCIEGMDHLWVSGCISGAIVEVYFNGKVQGQGIAEEGVVRLMLASKPSLSHDKLISAYQIVPGLGKGPSTTKSLESRMPSTRRAFRRPSYSSPELFGNNLGLSL